MAATASHDFGSDPQSQQHSESQNVEELQEERNELKWATERARRHLVRLGKWHRERGEPTSADLSGAATLVKVGDRKGILTAAHNIRCKFPGGEDAHRGETMEAIIGKLGRPSVAWADVDLTDAIVKGGWHSKGEPEEMGPDIAWIPLGAEKASFFERYGKVFFDWRDNRFPNFRRTEAPQADKLGQIVAGQLVTGFSFEREKSASHLIGPYLLEIVQDAFVLDREWAIDGWDYQERVLDGGGAYGEGEAIFDENVPATVRAAIPLRVNCVGGLSGGGLWLFGSEENNRYFDLVGVLWYQRWRDDDGVLRIVNHGRESIRKVIECKDGVD